MKRLLFVCFQLAIMPLPWMMRRYLLNLATGNRIDRTAKIGFSVVLAKRLVLGEGAVITHLTFVNAIDRLEMKKYSKIGRSNWITGANSEASMFSEQDRNCELVVGEHARITSKHHIDCTGGVYVGAYCTIAGIGTQILTHSIDIRLSRQVCRPVRIGNYCFIGTGAILLMGSTIPDYCVLGAGAVLIKAYDETHAVYGGNPATLIRRLERDECAYFSRAEGHVS